LPAEMRFGEVECRLINPNPIPFRFFRAFNRAGWVSSTIPVAPGIGVFRPVLLSRAPIKSERLLRQSVRLDGPEWRDA